MYRSTCGVSDESTNRLQTIILTYKDKVMEVNVDPETFYLLSANINMREQYAKDVYTMSFKSENVDELESIMHQSQMQDDDSLVLNPGETSEEDTSLSTISTNIKSEPMKWNTNLIKLLLDIRLSMESNFAAPSCKKKKLWEKVAQQFNKKCSYIVTAESCDLKYRNLLATYRANKKKKEHTGGEPIKWEFFEMMDLILGHKASSAPCKELLGSIDLGYASNPSCSNSENVIMDDNIDDEQSELPSHEPVPKKKRKKVEELPLKKYLFLKLQREEKKTIDRDARAEKKWQEKKELKLKEIEAINNLAQAISRTKD